MIETIITLPVLNLVIMLFFTLAVIKLLSLLVNRLLRSFNIAVRGWPPEHLDADGDIKDFDS